LRILGEARHRPPETRQNKAIAREKFSPIASANAIAIKYVNPIVAKGRFTVDHPPTSYRFLFYFEC
jgi:hypothetical protein